MLTTALAKFLVWLLERRSCTNCGDEDGETRLRASTLLNPLQVFPLSPKVHGSAPETHRAPVRSKIS